MVETRKKSKMAYVFSSENYADAKQNGLPAQNPLSSCATVKNGNQSSQDSQILFLLCELEAARSANKNLKAQLKAVQAELNNLKSTPEPPSARYCPGVISAMVSEIYQAQHERDDAMMSRIRLANDERDEALLRLDKLKRNDEGDSSFLSDADFLLNNQNAFLRDIVQRKRKQFNSKESLQLQNLDKDDDEDANSVLSVRTPNSLQKCFNSSSDDSKLDPEVHLRFVQQRLSEEMQAKEEAQATCQRLERLVEVLRRKVNGLAPQKSELLTDDL